MNGQHHLKELIATARDIHQSAKFVQSDLLILIEAAEQIKEVSPELEERTRAILNELNITRGMITESLETINNLYCEGLGALNGVSK